MILDVVGTIINDSKEKLEKAKDRFSKESYSDAIYYTYSGLVTGAKAILLSNDIKCNTQKKIVSNFQELNEREKLIDLPFNFEDFVFSINNQEPNKEFASAYLHEAFDFIEKVIAHRSTKKNEEVITSYYKA